ncbi:hypothetical protein, partial [Escherichia coli]|uniref:hypothetical protein n=1 Tax=Escherichia coli TaxID=562 RepID=UPI00312C7485
VDTAGSGTAGLLSSFAGDVVIEDSTFSARTSSSGDAGTVEFITSGDITLRASDVSSSTIGNPALDAGNAGNVRVDTDGNLNLLDGSTIRANSQTAGRGGDVSVVAAGTVFLDGGSSISSDSFDRGDSGLVSIFAGNLILDATR